MIYLELFLTFLKIGAFTFGGGLAMLAMAQQEVLSHGWMEQAEVVNFIAVSESTPGPFAVNMATFVGMKTAGLLGAVCSTLGIILPSFLIILLVARWITRFRESAVVRGIMSGLRPSVVGLIGASLLSVAGTVFGGYTATNPGLWVCVCIFVLCLVLIFRIKKLHPIWLIALSGALGIAAGYAGLLK